MAGGGREENRDNGVGARLGVEDRSGLNSPGRHGTGRLVGYPLRDHPLFQALLEKYADDVEH